MKKTFYNIICVGSLTAVLLAVAASCREDKFTESIFDTDIEEVDQNAATAPFDAWLYENFVVPYNTEIQYKLNFPATQLNYQLTPADYKKSQVLAYFIKYLFYDVYAKHGDKDFMKKYGPRIIHFIGSPAYSPTTHTLTLGYASGGVKITLINVNGIATPGPTTIYTAKDIERLNEDQFHTMHHEFSHILHQTKSYPVTFGQVTPGTYDGRTWQDRDSVESHLLGYVTQYGSSAKYEDFVETLSCTITDSDCRWMYTIIDACANGGVKVGDKQRVYTLIDSLQIRGLDDPSKPWNNFKIRKETATDPSSGEVTTRFVPSFHENDAKQSNQMKGVSLTLAYEDVEKFTSFRDYLDRWVQTDQSNETSGINAILNKLDIARRWYTAEWGLHLYALREEVRQRQYAINDYVRDNVVLFDYK